VISLSDCETRRRNMTERHGALGIPFQFVDAIDGRTRLIPDCVDGARVVREAFDTEAALACASSHRIVHRMIADGARECALILEDDAKFSADFREALDAAARLEFDVFKLEGGPYYRYHAVVERIAARSVVVGMVPPLGAATYLITRDAARRCCNLPVIDQACDSAFRYLRPQLGFLEYKPFVAVLDDETPTFLVHHKYPPRVRAGRRGLRKLIYSAQKRARIINLHGLHVAAVFELQRLRRIKPAPRQWSV
jgi:GR25 family glycosyltransferase involved in LPS biosynthesis